MSKISECPSCGNTRKGQSAKKCSQCGKITCQSCSNTGCTCGSKSYNGHFTIG